MASKLCTARQSNAGFPRSREMDWLTSLGLSSLRCSVVPPGDAPEVSIQTHSFSRRSGGMILLISKL